MSTICFIRAIHRWLIYGGPFDKVMGHNCYDIGGGYKCTNCSFLIRAQDVMDIDSAAYIALMQSREDKE